MSSQITEVVVVKLNDGVKLHDLAGSNASPQARAFVEASNILKEQNGVVRQFWGHVVEQPHLFCWTIVWASFEEYKMFHHSDGDELESFWTPLLRTEVFDLSLVAMLFNRVVDLEEELRAFRSKVTEVVFWTMPSRFRPDEQGMENAQIARVMQNAHKTGRATGAAIGEVFDAWPEALVAETPPVAIYGVIGWNSIDDHMKWRDSPEVRKYRSTPINVSPAVAVPGVDPKTGYFHVKFQEGL